MDMRTCDVCGKEFDFDKEGLGSSTAIVCGATCAKQSAASRGRKYAIHNEEDEVVETNVDLEDLGRQTLE